MSSNIAVFLLKFPDLLPHRQLFVFVLREFTDRGIGVIIKNDEESCMIRRRKQTDKARYLLIGAQERPDPFTFIWSVYHEYRHFLQKMPSQEEKEYNSPERYAREEDAWNKAEEKLSSTMIFQQKREGFYQFRNERLSSYL